MRPACEVLPAAIEQAFWASRGIVEAETVEKVVKPHLL
jgi:hypothetical protein